VRLFFSYLHVFNANGCFSTKYMICWGFAVICVYLWCYICVYMLDGERSCVRSEYRQIYARSCAVVDGPRVWRGCAANGRYRTAHARYRLDSIPFSDHSQTLLTLPNSVDAVCILIFTHYLYSITYLPNASSNTRTACS